VDRIDLSQYSDQGQNLVEDLQTSWLRKRQQISRSADRQKSSQKGIHSITSVQVTATRRRLSDRRGDRTESTDSFSFFNFNPIFICNL
jgi:hypothetical protein